MSKSGRGPLPGKTTDLARDGLRPRDLSRNNLYRAACAVALSAINSGWTFVDFDALLAERGSALGNQIRSGGRGRPDQTPREVRRLLRRAWTSAERKIAASPPHAPVEEVKAVVADVRARVPSLSPPFDVVMSCWADAAEQHVTLTPVFPIRVLAACARLTLTTAGRALTAVRDARLLRCVEHGEARPGGHASRYSLGPAWPDPGVKYALGESDAMEHTFAGGTHPLLGGDVFQPAEVCSTDEPPTSWDCADGDCPEPEEPPEQIRSDDMADDEITVRVRIRPGETARDALQRDVPRARRDRRVSRRAASGERATAARSGDVVSAEDEMRPRTREEVQREIDEEIEEQRANWLAMTPAQRLAALDELRDAYCEHECCEWDCKRATDLHWDIQSRALLIIDTDVHTARNDHEP